MRDFVSRIPRISPKHEPPNPHCMTLAVWQPPPIISADITITPILQEANSTPLQSPQRPRSPENFEITERGDNLSPERMDID